MWASIALWVFQKILLPLIAKWFNGEIKISSDNANERAAAEKAKLELDMDMALVAGAETMEGAMDAFEKMGANRRRRLGL